MWGNGHNSEWNNQIQHNSSNSSLDPNHYAHIPHNEVDWASLAQQWIRMKGTIEPQQPITNQIFTDTVSSQNQQTILYSKTNNLDSSQQIHQLDEINNHDVIGEAPMDIEEDTSSIPLYTRSISSSSSQVSTNISGGLNQTPSNALPSRWANPAQSPAYPNQGFMRAQNINTSRPGFSSWNQSSSFNPNTFVPNQKFIGSRFPIPNRRQFFEKDEHAEEELDAAKRRALPSWIREGLERVDREKRKAEEKDRLAAIREEERRRRLRENHLSILAMDNDDENDSKSKSSSYLKQQEEIYSSTFQEEDYPSQPVIPTIQEILLSMSKEEQQDHVMKTVRRQLTKLLLEVTNEEMRQITSKVLEKAKLNESKGLGDYYSGEDTDSEDEDPKPETDQLPDSDDELILEIERKKRNFELSNLKKENVELLNEEAAEMQTKNEDNSILEKDSTKEKRQHQEEISERKEIKSSPKRKKRRSRTKSSSRRRDSYSRSSPGKSRSRRSRSKSRSRKHSRRSRSPRRSRHHRSRSDSRSRKHSNRRYERRRSDSSSSESRSRHHRSRRH